MNSKIKVAVICLTYNHAPYIKEALEGFIKQNTTFSYRVYVHDDCSTDGTTDIIKEYANKYPEIIYPIFQSENQHSKGIQITKTYVQPLINSDYVAYCEGDDFWIDSYKLQKQITALDADNSLAACVHNSIFFDVVNQRSRIYNNRTRPSILGIDDLIPESGKEFQLASVVVRKNVWELFYDNDRLEFINKAKGFGDYTLGLHMALSGKILYIPDVMSVYRYGVSGSWTSRNKSSKQAILTLNSMIAVLKQLNEDTNHKYDALILDTIHKREFELLIVQGKIWKAFDGKYKCYYKDWSWKIKIKMLIKSIICKSR